MATSFLFTSKFFILNVYCCLNFSVHYINDSTSMSNSIKRKCGTDFLNFSHSDIDDEPNVPAVSPVASLSRKLIEFPMWIAVAVDSISLS